jgi:lipoprotein NlpI
LAIADYTQAIKIDPNFAVAYSNRGLARAGKGDHGGAVADFNKAIEVNPQSPYAYYVRGHARKVYYDHLDEAIADFNKAIEINPCYALAYYQRGLARYTKGDYDGAVADATKAIDCDRPAWFSIEPADVYALRGSAKLQQGKDAEAQHDFDSAIKFDSRWKSRLEAESTKIKQSRKPQE